MDKEEFLKQAKEDNDFIRKLAQKYIDYHGNMAQVDATIGTYPGFIDDMLYEDQDIAEKFQEAIDIIVANKVDREAAIRKISLIETLNDIVSDATEEKEGGPSVRDKVSAANLLVKLTDTKPTVRKEKRSLDEFL